MKNNDFCNVIMPSEHSKVLEFNQYQKSDKVSFTVYADFEYIIEKIDACKNSPEKFIYHKSKPTYSIRFFNVYSCLLYLHLEA